MRTHHRSLAATGLMLLTTLALSGCPSRDKNVCEQACEHIAECLGKSPSELSCPISASCGTQDRCTAGCYQAASCDTISGKESSGMRALATCLGTCISLTSDGGTVGNESTWYFPQDGNKDVDILFVLDTSNSMAEEQATLSKNFPLFIDALRTAKLGNKIPNVHIGVTTVDLGAGNYSLPSCEVAGGDGGKLQTMPRIAGCTPPGNPYISYIDGVTNVKSAVTDPVQQVKQAFQCIVEIGTGGCGFEQTLETARRALDPALNVNPGFIRKDASLAVVFITDEDDCSAANAGLYDPNADELGPLTSFRCFQHGFICTESDLTTAGPKTHCTPGLTWLHTVDSYVQFFKGLKPAGRVLMMAIAGPTDKVDVGLDAMNPVLRPSCQTTMGKGVPAIRIRQVVEAFGAAGRFNQGIAASGQLVPLSICSPDYSPALHLLAQQVTGTVMGLGAQCLPDPPLTSSGGLVCKAGEVLSSSVSCQQSCLEQADCIVEETVNQGAAVVVPRCDAASFENPANISCGGTCPCWRIVPAAGCASGGNAPYGFEILRSGAAAAGTTAKVTCRTSLHAWGSSELAALPQCK